MFPGHKICQLRNNNHRLRSGVAWGECDNTLERTLYFTREERRSSVLVCLASDMPLFAPRLYEEADTRIFARALEAAKMPNKKISSRTVDTDVVVLVIPVVQQF